MSSSPLIIIDCGASRAALGRFSQSAGRLTLEECLMEALPAPVAGADTWLEHTLAAFPRLRARTTARGQVVMVLPPHLLLTKLIRAPRVSATKRNKVVRFAAAQAIPYPMAEVCWDAVVAHEADTEQELLLAAVKQETVRVLVAAATEAGFEPAVLLPAPLATLATVRQAGVTGPVLALNLGARSVSILQIDGPRFAARTLAHGAGGTAELATRLTQEVTRSLFHFNRNGAMGRPARILLTGGCAAGSGLAEALAEQTRLPVERLDPLDGIELGPQERETGVAAHGGALADLIGAATLSLLPGHPSLNLLTAGLRRREGRHRRRPWLLAAVGLAAAALLPPLFTVRHLAKVTRDQTAALESALAPVREREARNRAALAEWEALRHEADQLQAVQARRTGWLGLFADFQQRLVQVEDVWLETLRTIPPTGDQPMKLAVSGRMLDRTNPLAGVSPETFNRVHALLAGLAGSRFVAAIEGERFDPSQPGVLRFDFVLVANPSHPL